MLILKTVKAILLSVLVFDMKILIIADDITGSLDTGAKFSARGLSTEIFGIEDFEQKLNKCTSDVAVINSETRHVTEGEAYKTVFSIVTVALKMRIPVILKKIDSVLRGHIGAELEAASDASGGKDVFLIPAYPDQGRTTVGGVQYLNGIPINQSEFSEDKLNPVTESNISKIIARESDIKVISLKASDPPKELGNSVVILDALTAEDIRRNVRECLSFSDKPLIFSGCAGVAMELAAAFSEKTCDIPFVEDHSLAVICGSCSPVTLNQLDFAEVKGCKRVSFEISELISDVKPDSYRKKTEQIRNICNDGNTIIIDISRRTAEKAPETDRPQISPQIVDGLSDVVSECEDALSGYTFLITGGDTLSAYMRKSWCSRIELIGEMFPGVVISRFSFEPSRKVKNIISKSGGYGSENIVIKCANFLLRVTANE